jgi:hypothetical protein
MAVFEWHECIKKITPYVFQVFTPDGSGTGSLLRNSASGTLCSVVTAAHVTVDVYCHDDCRLRDLGGSAYMVNRVGATALVWGLMHCL